MRPSSASNRRPAARGIALVEVLVYIGVFAVISTVAYAAFFKYWDAANRIERATDDIVGALNAGELWRADLRRAIRPPTLVRQEGEEALELEMTGAKVVYLFSSEGVWRQTSPTTPWVRLVPRVRQSRMFADARDGIAAWRWELELALPKKSPGKLIPRFTFVAVTSTPSSP